MRSLRGHLLVAAPGLPDRNFYRSVVLIIHHDDKGAFGLVLNRPTNSTVSEIWETVAGGPCESSELINLGGPVTGPLMALHNQRDYSENEVLPGVYFATHKDHLTKIVRHPQCRYRIFSGYSGWGSGQLEGELKAGGWMTLKATSEHVFAPADALWKSVSQVIGEKITQPLLKHARRPNDPSSN
jgi:putative transcriptional regulator